MNLELLRDGFLLMIIGMGFVYFFIVVMIQVMQINAKVLNYIAKFFPEDVEEDKYQAKKKVSTDNVAEIALAIACAMKERSKAC